MIPTGSETQKLPAAVAAVAPRYQNERDDNAERSEKGVRDGCFSAASLRVIKYATGLSDVFIKLYSCPCLSKLCLLVCSFIRCVFGAQFACSPPFNNNTQPDQCAAEVQTAENVFERESEREKGKCDGADFALPGEKVVF
jgi:hypothetical protein